MRPVYRAALIVGGLALCVTPSAYAAGAALTQDAVKGEFAKAEPTCKFDWKSIQIAPPRRASIGEIKAAGLPPKVIVTPVRVAYTKSGCGFTRDYTWNYHFYKDDFGGWTKQSNAMPGNAESEPR